MKQPLAHCVHAVNPSWMAYANCLPIGRGPLLVFTNASGPSNATRPFTKHCGVLACNVRLTSVRPKSRRKTRASQPANNAPIVTYAQGKWLDTSCFRRILLLCLKSFHDQSCLAC